MSTLNSPSTNVVGTVTTKTYYARVDHLNNSGSNLSPAAVVAESYNSNSGPSTPSTSGTTSLWFSHFPYGTIVRSGASSQQRRGSDSDPPPVTPSTKKKNKKRTMTSPYSPPRNPNVMCCYFKQNGNCKMGADCWHGHEGSAQTPCHYGSQCRVGHASLSLPPAPTDHQ